ncbi:hypothetical protein ACDY96_31005 [Rhizobium mongolense]|uniref:hypothetical protein n=1 Tax=Rhizobium mongolense TaxID=57676 RepID=UPI00355839DF
MPVALGDEAAKPRRVIVQGEHADPFGLPSRSASFTQISISLFVENSNLAEI